MNCHGKLVWMPSQLSTTRATDAPALLWQQTIFNHRSFAFNFTLWRKLRLRLSVVQSLMANRKAINANDTNCSNCIPSTSVTIIIHQFTPKWNVETMWIENFRSISIWFVSSLVARSQFFDFAWIRSRITFVYFAECRFDPTEVFPSVPYRPKNDECNIVIFETNKILSHCDCTVESWNYFGANFIFSFRNAFRWPIQVGLWPSVECVCVCVACKTFSRRGTCINVRRLASEKQQSFGACKCQVRADA